MVNQVVNAKSETPRQRNEDTFSNNFLVIIHSSENGTVVGRLPEEIQMQLASEWDSPLLQGSGSGVVEIAAQNVLGRSTKTQFASAQVWSGSSPIELTIPLEFYADEDANREVIQPIVRLARMALPRQSGDAGDRGLFIPPGPRIFPKLNQEAANDTITIYLGNFLAYTKVVLISVNPTFVTKDISPEGVPLRAACEVTFRSMYTLTGQELQNQFVGFR